MTWDDNFLDTAEAVLRQELASLREQVSAREELLTRITLIRESLVMLKPLVAAATHPERAGGLSTPTDPGDATPTSPGDATPTGPGAPKRRLSDVNQKTLDVLAAAPQPMRARDVVKALGAPDRRSVVEGTRTRLKRLVASGHLIEHGGLFSAASTVNGHAQKGAALEEDR